MASPQQQVLRFDIAMDHSLIMRKLQGVSHLLGKRNNSRYRKECSPGVALAHCAMRSKVHHQKGSLALNAKFQDTHDIRMDQMCNDSCLTTKRSDILV